MSGDVNFDDGNIWIDGSIADLLAGDDDAANDIITIHWSQVPEPATLGLMVLGGLALVRRRRR